jgi:structural maintenance of chromosome 2
VQNLFHSVQLNVNNPHFLIMQGRITKVLNMKPPEILGLLEEAAGTKMYESKKQAAVRTLEKKQVKVEEINKVLNEDIMPALEKLRKEKVQYMEWQNASANLERLERFCVAYKYVEALSLQQDGEGEIRDAAQLIAELEANISLLDSQMREHDDEIQGLQTEKELQSNGEVKELVQEVDELSKRLVKDTSKWNNTVEAVTAEQATYEQLKGALAELQEEVLAARVASATEKRDLAANELEQAVLGVEAAQNELAGAEAGDGRDASNRSLQERLADAQNAQTQADAEAKAAETRAKHLQKQLDGQQKLFAAKRREGSQLESKLQKERDGVEEARQRLAALCFDASASAALEESVEKGRAKVNQLQDTVDELTSQLAAVEFQYHDPERGFDRSRVKGVVAKLVQIQDPKAATALEVVAGGKLYQVIVDTEQTAKALLANGKLRSRVTIIPLNKVSYRTMPGEALAAAKKLAGEKAQPALELVGYDQQLTAAMQYVFGGSFVCQDPGTAKKLAFSREVASRCVTLDGDDFNPGGTLTGGSRNKSASMLTQLHSLADAQCKLQHAQAALKALQGELRALNSVKIEYEK